MIVFFNSIRLFEILSIPPLKNTEWNILIGVTVAFLVRFESETGTQFNGKMNKCSSNLYGHHLIKRL
jgi:hypothetical protein